MELESGIWNCTHARVDDFDSALGLQPGRRVIEMGESGKPSLACVLVAFAGREQQVAGLVVVHILALDSIRDGLKVTWVRDDGVGVGPPEPENNRGSRQLGSVDEGGDDGDQHKNTGLRQ